MIQGRVARDVFLVLMAAFRQRPKILTSGTQVDTVATQVLLGRGINIYAGPLDLPLGENTGVYIYIGCLRISLTDMRLPELMVATLLSKGNENVDAPGTYYLRLCQYLVRDSISDSARDQRGGSRRGISSRHRNREFVWADKRRCKVHTYIQTLTVR